MLTIQFAIGGIVALLVWQIWCFVAGFIFQDNENALVLATAPIPCLIGWLSWYVVVTIKKHYFNKKWVRIRLYRQSSSIAATDVYAPKHIAKNFNTDQSQSHYAVIMPCVIIPYKYERYNEKEQSINGWDITPWLVS
jgi:hypothetical protein